MVLKEFMKLHKSNFSYEIHIKRIGENGENIYLDFADNFENPWERYFAEYFNCTVSFFGIEVIDQKIVLVIYIEI